MLAYARYGERRMVASELDKNFGDAGLTYELVGGTYKKDGGTISDWNAHGTQAIFASCPDFAICSFRGTEKDDPADAVSDGNAILAHEPDYRLAQDSRPALGHLGFIDQLFTEPCLVHRGFQSALNQVWDQIHTLITTYRSTHPQKEICLTGHSLGAALAVLAFSRFADPDMSLFTFGCPRVGDSAFRDRALSNQGRGIYRFVNFNDAVTHVPTESLFYRQTPEACYKITEEGNLETEDHSSFKGDLQSL
jgi:predicted lipase